MTNARWFVTIPHCGAARMIAQHAADALSLFVNNTAIKVFDTIEYLSTFKKLLKEPDDLLVTDLMNQSLAIACLDSEATRLLVPALTKINPFTLRLLRKQGVKAIHWFYEDFRRADYWKEFIPEFDVFCAMQYGPIPDACAKAGTEYIFLPTASSFTSPGALCHDRLIDAAFVGIPSPYRIKVLELLHAQGVSLIIAGTGWKNYKGPLEERIQSGDWVDEAAYLQIFHKCKIGLNLSVEDPANDRENMQISPRAFDIMAAGCILVTEDVPLLDVSVSNCTKFIFNNPDEICSVARQVLDTYNNLQTIIRNNAQSVRAAHTFPHRIKELLIKIGDFQE